MLQSFPPNTYELNIQKNIRLAKVQKSSQQNMLINISRTISLTSIYYYPQTGLSSLVSKMSYLISLELHTGVQRKRSTKQPGKEGHRDKAPVSIG